MTEPRKPIAQLYLSTEEIALLDGLRDRFTSDWERTTGQTLTKSETVRRMIYWASKRGPGQ